MKQFLIALDQLANAVLGGWADETLSARAWRLRDRMVWGVLRRVIDALMFWQDGHCEQAFLSEQMRRQLPVEYRPL